MIYKDYKSWEQLWKNISKYFIKISQRFLPSFIECRNAFSSVYLSFEFVFAERLSRLLMFYHVLASFFPLFPPLSLFPSIDGHGRVYKRSITVPASLRSLLLCLFISKVFNLSFEKYYFRIIFFLCSRMKNSLINTILIPVLELHWNIIRIVFTKIWKLIKNFLGKY